MEVLPYPLANLLARVLCLFEKGMQCKEAPWGMLGMFWTHRRSRLYLFKALLQAVCLSKCIRKGNDGLFPHGALGTAIIVLLVLSRE